MNYEPVTMTSRTRMTARLGVLALLVIATLASFASPAGASENSGESSTGGSLQDGGEGSDEDPEQIKIVFKCGEPTSGGGFTTTVTIYTDDGGVYSFELKGHCINGEFSLK